MTEAQTSSDRQIGRGDREPILFNAVLTPNRSLRPRAARRFLAVFCVVSAIIGAIFLAYGWWPVAGYFGLDVLLLWWAFRASYVSGRLTERLCLTDTSLTVARVHPNATRWNGRFSRLG